MLMRKKVFLLLSAVCLVSALFTFNAYAGIEDAGDITLPEGDLDVVNRCRCKHEGCYGGNAQSSGRTLLKVTLSMIAGWLF